MDVRAAAGQPALRIEHEIRSVVGWPLGDGRPERDADELALRRDGAAAGARAHRLPPARSGDTRSRGGLGAQEETSDSQLIARWRSRARSPMSMPVVVAIASIGVLIRSSGEWMFAVASTPRTSSSTPSSSRS